MELMKRMPTVEELAAWHLQAALRGFLVRHRERKMRGLPPGHAKTCPPRSFQHSTPSGLQILVNELHIAQIANRSDFA